MNDWRYQLLLTLIVILTTLLLRWSLTSLLVRYIKKTKLRYVYKKSLTYLSYLIIVLALAYIWIDEFDSAATFLGLVSAGLAIALKDPIANFFGWVYIVFSRPFEMSDRIEIDTHKGDVLDINFFEFTILEIGAIIDANQSTGRIVHIPNGKVFTNPVINATQGFQYIWKEIPITITFKSDWKKAKNILLEIENDRVKDLAPTAKKEIHKSERKYNIHYNKLTPTVYTSGKPYGICLTLRYLTNPRNERASEQLIWEEVLTRFAEQPDIHFAYPSQRIYLENESGGGKE
ncbi:MAG: mechanosensitive ion channel [Saprospiraceae bacterium]